jgi:hypothetical protein
MGAAPSDQDISNHIGALDEASARRKWGNEAIDKYQQKQQEKSALANIQSQLDQSNTALKENQDRQSGYDAQLQSQMKQADALQQAMQKQYETYDPEAYAKATANAAAMANAAAARRAGATAGKAARLGNVGMGQTYATALGQGQDMKSQLAGQAFGAIGSQQNLKAGQAQTYGQQALGWGGLASDSSGQYIGGLQEGRKIDEQVETGDSNRFWKPVETIGATVGGAAESAGKVYAATK